MASFFKGGPTVWFITLGALFLGFGYQAAHAQKGAAPDLEQHHRAVVAAWNANDPARIVEAEGIGNGVSGAGFGYRARDFRNPRSKEDDLAALRKFFASLERYRITQEDIHTSVDGNIGLVWGFFTEDFQIRGRAPEKVRVRFTETLKRDTGGWHELLYHRDGQHFDDKGSYIPVPAATK
jgi:hypothetical protein